MQYWQVMFHVLAGMMVLFVASRIPDLVNPQSRGLFSGFAQALAMSGAAAAMIGGGVAGAVAGAAGSSSVGRMASSLRSFASRIGRGGNTASPGENNAGAQALEQSGNEGGRTPSGPPNPISGSTVGGERDLGVSGGDSTMPPSGGSEGGGGGGGAAAGGAGFLASMGRGFMAGASRGTLVGRAMRDMQSGNFFTNDPSTTYQGTSQAQLQGFREYTRGVSFGSTEDSRERFDRAMERRGRHPVVVVGVVGTINRIAVPVAMLNRITRFRTRIGVATTTTIRLLRRFRYYLGRASSCVQCYPALRRGCVVLTGRQGPAAVHLGGLLPWPGCRGPGA